ncbi:MAG: ISL3 family transposase, partial [Ktedonobacteraceae bacterium]|nr:ISL3 family transposase [Ktedonobacteraceae bacterium]
MEVQPALALPEGLEITGIEMIDEALTITAISTQRSPCCPLCGSPAARVHSRYTRRLADLPCGGHQVRLLVLVRKCFCEVPTCARKIFAERIIPFVAPWARVTARLFQIVQAIGLATGGMLGARLAEQLGIRTSWMTILRWIMALPTVPIEQVSQLGVDDFAIRRGRKYGTILVDMESHQVIDVLPDRSAETVAAWMQAHPEIDLVSRDRGTDYATAATQGAPQATQVADRFHLAKNLTEIAEVVLARIRPEIRKAVQPEVSSLQQGDDGNRADWKPKTEADEQQAGLARQAERCDRYQQMRQWYEQGLPTRDIAHRLGVTRRTVQNWIKKGIPYAKPRQKRKSCFDPYADAAIALWQNGALSSLQIWQALQTQGFKGSYNTVHRFIETLPEYIKRRVGNGGRSLVLPEHPLQHFQAREAVWLFVRDPHDLDETEQSTLQAIREASPTAETLYQLVQEFMLLLRQRKGERLDAWLENVAASQISELSRMVRSIERDKAAVVAGFTLLQNNGLVEGKVNKLKLIK